MVCIFKPLSLSIVGKSVSLFWETYLEMSWINQVWHNVASLIKNVSDMDITTLRIIWGFSTGTLAALSQPCCTDLLSHSQFYHAELNRAVSGMDPLLTLLMAKASLATPVSPSNTCVVILNSCLHSRPERKSFFKSLYEFGSFIPSNRMSFISPFETAN